MPQHKKQQIETTTKISLLDSLEEKIIRMRHGLTTPAQMPLDQHTSEHPHLAEQLAEFERRAFAQVAARPTEIKDKIIRSLKRPSTSKR